MFSYSFFIFISLHFLSFVCVGHLLYRYYWSTVIYERIQCDGIDLKLLESCKMPYFHIINTNQLQSYCCVLFFCLSFSIMCIVWPLFIIPSTSLFCLKLFSCITNERKKRITKFCILQRHMCENDNNYQLSGEFAIKGFCLSHMKYFNYIFFSFFRKYICKWIFVDFTFSNMQDVSLASNNFDVCSFVVDNNDGISPTYK